MTSSASCPYCGGSDLQFFERIATRGNGERHSWLLKCEHCERSFHCCPDSDCRSTDYRIIQGDRAQCAECQGVYISPSDWHRKCPYCGSVRTTFEAYLMKCLECGASPLPCCPDEKCRYTRIEGTEDKTKVRCSICGTQFDRPREGKGELAQFLDELQKSESDVSFLMRWSEGLNRLIPEIPSYDQYEMKEGRSASKIDYLRNLHYFVKLPRMLKLRDLYSGSPNRQLPAREHFAQDVLGDNNVFNHASERLRFKRAELVREALAEVLGVRQKRSIQELRDDVIVECYNRDITRAEAIARELDAHEDLTLDPLLRKWEEEHLISLTGWADALNHEVVGRHVRSLFSKTWRRKGNA